jgi:hypothetical protein
MATGRCRQTRSDGAGKTAVSGSDGAAPTAGAKPNPPTRRKRRPISERLAFLEVELGSAMQIVAPDGVPRLSLEPMNERMHELFESLAWRSITATSISSSTSEVSTARSSDARSSSVRGGEPALQESARRRLDAFYNLNQNSLV